MAAEATTSSRPRAVARRPWFAPWTVWAWAALGLLWVLVNWGPAYLRLGPADLVSLLPVVELAVTLVPLIGLLVPLRPVRTLAWLLAFLMPLLALVEYVRPYGAPPLTPWLLWLVGLPLVRTALLLAPVTLRYVWRRPTATR